MPTEQEAKPAVVTPSLQQWRSPSTFRGAPGEDPLKWLKEYDRVANFNKWDDMMCLANVYFFLDGTARQWYVNNEDALDSWEAFKNGLSGLFGDRQRYTRRAEEQLKCRAQRSGESTQSYIQSVLGLCQEVNPLMREDEKVSHLMKGVAEDIYQALLTREINDTASFIKWCNYIEDMKQKRVGRPRFERLPNVVPVASLTDETDLVSLIRTIVREEVHRLVNQTQESLDSDPQSLEEIVQDEVERVLAPVSTKPTETRPRPTYATVTRKYRAPVQKFPPQPRKTDVWRTADNRPVCFHCGRPGHVMRYCRERRLSLTTLETADGTSTTLALKKKYADQTLLAVLRQVPREADPQYVVTDPRRHIADPVSRQAVGARKTKQSDLQGGEAACTGNPPSTAKMTGNQLDVIIDKKPIRALVDSGASFSVISDKYRRFLKKVLFADAKSVMLKVADGNFVRPIGKCVLRVRINNRELPFEFIVLSHCSHDVILGWDF
ncbi:CCHC-type domain-containing protein [Trichonephila clavipes]|nr:CCHC-type domain-containing protein [Trichonephila clavipes]